MKQTRIRVIAIVIEELKGSRFRLRLQDNASHEVIATLGGKMMLKQINLCADDIVTVELSPYDLTRGRVIWRQS